MGVVYTDNYQYAYPNAVYEHMVTEALDSVNSLYTQEYKRQQPVCVCVADIAQEVRSLQHCAFGLSTTQRWRHWPYFEGVYLHFLTCSCNLSALTSVVRRDDS